MPKDDKGVAVAKTSSSEKLAKFESRLLEQAQTPQERTLVFEKMSEYRQAQIIREAATAIAGLSWGKALSPYAQAAIARYALETGTDPVRGWIVIGDNLFDTSALWYDLATSQPDYLGYEHEYINEDTRADDDERRRRRQLRVKHNVPEDVKGACIVVIYRMINGTRTPFVGVNWAGNRKCYIAAKKAEGIKLDPVGEQDPGKTAFTRAFRRAAKTAWPIWPYRRQWPSDEGLPLEELGRAAVGNLLKQGREAEKRGGGGKAQPGMYPANPDTPPAVEVEPGLKVRTSHTQGEVDADAAQRAYEDEQMDE